MPNPSSNTHPIALVIGATGKTGRRVVERLRARGIETREASRSGNTPFDWGNRDTWAPALEGVNLAYVTYAPDLAVPEAVPAIRAFARFAAEREIERLVLLSGRGEEEAQRCEEIVREANPRWTIVRASWFSQNFSEAFLLEPLRHGVLTLPAGEIPEPFVDANDIADVASRALAEEGHEGEIYEVTGPRLLTFAEAVEEIAAATKRELRYEQVPVDSFVEGMRGLGIPADIVSLTRYLFETVLDGRNAQTTDGIRRALGRAPRDFSEYVRNTASTGIWAEPARASV
ncbi:MAG: NmrA family transcriptional regulator [Candidatus Eisenbacteria bacterium]